MAKYTKEEVKKYVYKKHYKNGKTKAGKPLFRNKKVVKRVILKPKKTKEIINAQKEIAIKLARSGANTHDIESFLKQTMKKTYITHEQIKKIGKRYRKEKIRNPETYKEQKIKNRHDTGDIYAFKSVMRGVNKNYLSGYLANISSQIASSTDEYNEFMTAYIKDKYADAINLTDDIIEGRY